MDAFEGDMGKVADYLGICEGAGALIACVLVPLIGKLSDAKGRIIGLLISSLTSSANIIVLYTCVVLKTSGRTLKIMFAMSSLVSKITTQASCYSFVADCTSFEKMPVALVEAGGIKSLAQAVGPLVARLISRFLVQYLS